MATNGPPLFHTILGNVEVEGVMISTDGKSEKRTWYSVRLYVANKEVAKSTKKLASSVLKWEWNAENQISFGPSSIMKIVLYRGFKADITPFDSLVGQYEGNLADLITNNAGVNMTDTKGIPVPVKMKIALSPAFTSDPQDNPYLALGGPPGAVFDSETRVKAVGGVVYEGLKGVVDVLYQCSDVFPSLKAATAVFQKITKFVETILENKQELKDLEAKLGVILSIVEKYKMDGGVDAISHRIKGFSKAITVQLKAIEALQERSMFTRAASAQKDADTILKALRNIISLCDIFQMDTQLNIDITVGKILECMNSGLIDKLNHEMISYKTRTSSYGDPTGCMEGTRVKVLEDLDAWSSDADAHKVYWMVGMAGVGKSTIAHTFCQILEAKNMLSGSFFASRASEKASNARLIIPVIARALARSSPPIKFNVVKAIEDDSTLAESTYLNMREQFKQLVYDPIQATSGMLNKPYKVVVIDAVDECVNLEVVVSFIKLVLESASKIPLKVFISSRQELEISDAFSSGNYEVENLRLHDIEKDVVQEDIRKYLETSLAGIRDKNRHGTAEAWPSESELEALIARCGTLFIYAATAIRYIASGGRRYKSRLSEMAHQGLESVTEFKTDIDTLYLHILEMACKEKRLHEVTRMRDIVSIVVFLRNPLPIQAIKSLSEMDALSELSLLTSVIHLPDAEEAAVAPFHASFPDFITSPIRCSPERSPFHALDAAEGHTLLALKCLKLMNRLLKYNICEIPEELTRSHRERTNSPDNAGKISAAVQYSCIYWATHLAEVKEFDHELTDALRVFLREHLLHWIECLSILGELPIGLKSLRSIAAVLSSFEYHDLQLFVDDARRCIQMNFDAIQKHCMEIYQSALVWIPKESLIRQTYDAHVRKVPQVRIGLPDLWGAAEVVMQNGSMVNSVTFSPDGSQVLSGSSDGNVRIWDATTGKIETELKGHTNPVKSVAFFQNGSQVASGSDDGLVRIWNITMGEVEAEQMGRTGRVNSVVAFSQDGSRVVAGAADKLVRVWNVTTGEVEAELRGHTSQVYCVAFSRDGSRVVSGSADKTIRIWNVVTGKVEVELKGHTDWVRSVVFSQDGRQVVSGSDDKTVRIWNAVVREVGIELVGHQGSVRSIAFSQDGSRVASGSADNTVRIWNVVTGKVEAELKGHTSSVRSVALSQDGTRVVSGSSDNTVRIWTVTTSKDRKVESHRERVYCVAFSQDGSRVVSGSTDKRVRIWNVTTGEVGTELKGHTDWVMSVAFSQDGGRIVSGSADHMVRVWNAITGEAEAELKGHTGLVNSVAFAQDSSGVVSGSADNTVRIWNVTTGQSQLMTTSDVKLPDGSRVTRATPQEFRISYPTQQNSANSALRISDDRQWITASFCHCCIPPQYRSISCSSSLGSQICLGFTSGHVLVLDIAAAL